MPDQHTVTFGHGSLSALAEEVVAKRVCSWCSQQVRRPYTTIGTLHLKGQYRAHPQSDCLPVLEVGLLCQECWSAIQATRPQRCVTHGTVLLPGDPCVACEDEHDALAEAWMNRQERAAEIACPHGELLGDCNDCDILGDLAFDAARESR